jgi:hypothetical protein
MQPKEPQWLLDTAAVFHVSSRHDIFYNLQDYKASINDASSHTHQITGIRSVYVHGVEIPNV